MSLACSTFSSLRQCVATVCNAGCYLLGTSNNNTGSKKKKSQESRRRRHRESLLASVVPNHEEKRMRQEDNVGLKGAYLGHAQGDDYAKNTYCDLSRCLYTRSTLVCILERWIPRLPMVPILTAV